MDINFFKKTDEKDIDIKDIDIIEIGFEKFMLNDSLEDSLNNRKTDIKTICDAFIKPYTRFKTKRDYDFLCSKILKYIVDYDRVLYSEISSYFFSLNGEKRVVFLSNIDFFVEKIFSSSSKIKISENNNIDEEYFKKIVLKIWDHVHLADQQYNTLTQDDDEFKRKVTEHMFPIKNDVENELNAFTRNMTSQLISLVGIFTAMSFLVFGGINSLDNIFSGAKDIPILKLSIIGSIWSLCITNLIFVFMFFISKMSDMKISVSDNGNMIKKYPLVFWANLVSSTILILSVWIHILDKYNRGISVLNIFKWRYTSIALLIAIIVMFFIGAYTICKLSGKCQNCIDKNKNIT